jgi:hypothetical protein
MKLETSLQFTTKSLMHAAYNNLSLLVWNSKISNIQIGIECFPDHVRQFLSKAWVEKKFTITLKVNQ